MSEKRYVVYTDCYGGFSLSKKAKEWLFSKGCQDLRKLTYDRTNKLLVECIRELGDDANTKYSNFKIREIPAGYSYRINEYDGKEYCSTYAHSPELKIDNSLTILYNQSVGMTKERMAQSISKFTSLLILDYMSRGDPILKHPSEYDRSIIKIWVDSGCNVNPEKIDRSSIDLSDYIYMEELDIAHNTMVPFVLVRVNNL